MYILPPQKGYYFLGGEGVSKRPNTLRHLIGISRGVGVLRLWERHG